MELQLHPATGSLVTWRTFTLINLVDEGFPSSRMKVATLTLRMKIIWKCVCPQRLLARWSLVRIGKLVQSLKGIEHRDACPPSPLEGIVLTKGDLNLIIYDKLLEKSITFSTSNSVACAHSNLGEYVHCATFGYNCCAFLSAASSFLVTTSLAF